MNDVKHPAGNHNEVEHLMHELNYAKELLAHYVIELWKLQQEVDNARRKKS